MATAGTLIETIADVLCLERVTVAGVYRSLREAGLIETGGRGRSARQVTAEDCTALLIGILASDSAKHAADAAQEYSELRAFSPRHLADRGGSPAGPRTWHLGPLELPRLRALPAGHTFGEAVKALIEAGMDGELETGAEADPWDDNPAVSVNVVARTPWRVGHIDVRGGSYSEYMWYFCQEDIDDDFKIWARGSFGPIPRTGRYGIVTDRRCADDILLDLGRLLRPLRPRSADTHGDAGGPRP